MQHANHPPDLLVAAARAGDPRALTELHRRYCRMVHGILLGYVSPEDADDLVQEVFLTAFQRLAQLRQDATFGAWIARIARNRAKDQLRAARPMEALPDNLPALHRPRAEALEALAALRALPEAYRETLILRLVEGMTGPEIAEKTGLTPGSVRVNLHRGMKLLRERLGVGEP